MVLRDLIAGEGLRLALCLFGLEFTPHDMAWCWSCVRAGWEAWRLSKRLTRRRPKPAPCDTVGKKEV